MVPFDTAGMRVPLSVSDAEAMSHSDVVAEAGGQRARMLEYLREVRAETGVEPDPRILARLRVLSARWRD